MRILIPYEASWRASFLSGSNNEPPPKGGRDFIASSSRLSRDASLYQRRDISHDTVMGVLNRLVGEQAKLYQARAREDYYFATLEDRVSFEDRPSTISEEIVFLRNLSGNFDRNAHTGAVLSTHEAFTGKAGRRFWATLFLEPEDLAAFILDESVTLDPVDTEPLGVIERFGEIGKMRLVKPEDYPLIAEAAKSLHALFASYKPTNKAGRLIMQSLYASALYLQRRRLMAKGLDLSSMTAKQGGLMGISHNNFTPSDFMKSFTTGKRKLVYGNPYVLTEYVKNQGKVRRMLVKASGELDIRLDIPKEKAEELASLIANAAVSSFPLGKKGLAYVREITC